ncbi:MAG: maltose ABC transporter permease MalF [Verrucomicrobia bacterium]|nr:maltose ABC transporter permease MalF [Verrucomicrobiota bacterium]MBV9672901.1 maltose ABC transporter permease MalF [Verrucomicrobiota bacterium]
MTKGSPLSLVIVALVALPALYLDFVLYQAGTGWIALIFLIIIALFVFVYLSPSAYTFRYLFPGLFGFALFVIFPLLYTVLISFTKYSSQNLLPLERVISLLRQETFSTGGSTFQYKLFKQSDTQYILYLQDEKDPARRFASDPFDLTVSTGSHAISLLDPQPLQPLPPGQQPPGQPLEMPQVTRAKLFIPMRGRQFVLPDDKLVSMEGLQKFSTRDRLWILNPDRTLTNRKDGTIIRPDFRTGFFVNEKGQRYGVGFRVFSGFENYMRIVTDPRIQGPFVRIFVWTVTFSALSVLSSFGVGVLIAVILEWKEVRFRGIYRTLLILPYAVPAVLSILIFKGLFNQEFGAVNEFLRAMFHFAPEWETNPWGARVMLLLVNVWLGYPYMMLISTGMLQSIPVTIYEASAIDGSNPLKDFYHITLPLIIPPLLPILISSFAFNFNNFNLIYLLTAGGPKMVGGGIAGETDLLVNYTFNIAFRDSGTNYGLASAVATLLFIIVGTLAWINLRMSGRRI